MRTLRTARSWARGRSSGSGRGAARSTSFRPRAGPSAGTPERCAARRSRSSACARRSPGRPGPQKSVGATCAGERGAWSNDRSSKCGRRRWAQVDLRRTGAPPDRCFLPDLTRFRGFRRTGPEPIFGGRAAILSEPRRASAREHERHEERDRAREAGEEIDVSKAARRSLRPGSDLVAEGVQQREESEPEESAENRGSEPPSSDHVFFPARDRTKARTDRARSGGISSGFKSLSVLPVAW